MNLKGSFLLPAALFALITMALRGYPNISHASRVEPSPKVDTTAQVSKDMLENRQENIIEQIYAEGRGIGMYVLVDPNIMFFYDPSDFVLDFFKEDAETAQPASETSFVSLVHFWSKQDYVTLKSAGSEVGDFPPKLKLSVHANSEELSLENWITTQGSSVFHSEVKNIKKSNTAIADREAWTFSYTSLFEYDSIAFRNTEDQVVVISLGLPVRESSDVETIEDDEDYLTALSILVGSIVPTTTAPDEGREIQ